MDKKLPAKNEKTLIALWVPNDLLEALDRAVESEDSDRSKIVRNAIRRKIEAPKEIELEPVAA